jgi:hypothetical protein
MLHPPGKPPTKVPSDLPKMEYPAQDTMRRALVQAYFEQMQKMNAEIVEALQDPASPPRRKGR